MPHDFGRDVLGPIVAEFCLQLWSLESMVDQPDDVALLFCARGGLRMQLAYERFLAATSLRSRVHRAPLMVSRVVAVRPALMRMVEQGAADLTPWVASTMEYEFAHSSVADAALAITGVRPPIGAGGDQRCTPARFSALLRHPDGAEAVAELGRQASLFERHLEQARAGRRRVLLVDTGLYGTTGQLLAEGLPDLDVGSVLIARSYRPGPAARASTVGLAVEAAGYSALRRRTALLRYWHLVEWLFEPDLSSVRSFGEVAGEVRSNLEVAGWRERVQPTPGSLFAGVLDYLNELPAPAAARVLVDADRAWTALHRAITFPSPGHAAALAVGVRTHDFGLTGTWSARPWQGPLAALRGSTMWREGEIARSGSRLRRPLLAAVETAYGARQLKRAVTARVRRGR